MKVLTEKTVVLQMTPKQARAIYADLAKYFLNNPPPGQGDVGGAATISAEAYRAYSEMMDALGAQSLSD